MVQKTLHIFVLSGEYCDEIIRLGMQEICLDFVGQPPMIRYHPMIFDGYIKKTGIDPRSIEIVKTPSKEVYMVRIPDDGSISNMISDIETWCVNGYIDSIMVHPLRWLHGMWKHDIHPYIRLGKRTGIKIIGGINSMPVEGFQLNPVCVARRMVEQLDI